MRVGFLLVTALVAAGCGRTPQTADPPGYTLVIPDDVLEHVILTDKDGAKREGNGRELYAKGHKQGWPECWEGHRKGWVNLGDDADWQRFVPQDDGPVQEGFAAGFAQCQRFLREQR